MCVWILTADRKGTFALNGISTLLTLVRSKILILSFMFSIDLFCTLREERKPNQKKTDLQWLVWGFNQPFSSVQYVQNPHHIRHQGMLLQTTCNQTWVLKSLTLRQLFLTCALK